MTQRQNVTAKNKPKTPRNSFKAEREGFVYKMIVGTDSILDK